MTVFSYSNLYTPEGINGFEQRFISALKINLPLYEAYLTNEISETQLVELTRELEAFVKPKVGLAFEEHLQQHVQQLRGQEFAASFKKKYIAPLKRKHFEEAYFPEDIHKKYLQQTSRTRQVFLEDAFMRDFEQEIKDENKEALEKFYQYVHWAINTREGALTHKSTFLFSFPRRWASSNNSFLEKGNTPGALQGVASAKAFKETAYCLKCHKRGKDSCSTGLWDRFNPDKIVSNARVELSGCPLDQKISQMAQLYEEGYILGALAMVLRDNPLALLTGHRVCFDCVNSCVFQTQEGVDIPFLESHIVKTVLEAPYGFEVYSLLVKWNPLRGPNSHTESSNTHNFMVAGAGPAGIAASLYALNAGHQVVMVDGMKIEALPEPLLEKRLIAETREELKDKITTQDAFGGVAAYGITDRWDKFNLMLARLLLERHGRFKAYGGVRLGTTVTTKEIFFDYGFDHLVMALGAGKPQNHPLINNNVGGVRYGADFLMASNLYSPDDLKSLALYDVDLPTVVIGGGLTAIDTATETIKYYVRLCKKVHRLLNQLKAEEKIQEFLASLTHNENNKLQTLDKQGKEAIEAESAGEYVNKEALHHHLTRRWGGVHLIYRNSIDKSPAYNINYPEIQEALDYGVQIYENATLEKLQTDENNQLTGVTISQNGKPIDIEAKMLFQAIGTSPNTVIADEDDAFIREDRFIKHRNQENHDFFVHKTFMNHYVSQLGDMHPRFQGSVVKALASAKEGYPHIEEALEQRSPTNRTWEETLQMLDEALIPVVTKVEQGPYSVNFTVKAPQAAKHFLPGQVYKLERFSAHGPRAEGVPVSGLEVNDETGEITFSLGYFSPSAKKMATLKPGEQVYLMGPTGSTIPLDQSDQVLLIGEGYGKTFLKAFAHYCQKNGIPYYFATDSYTPEPHIPLDTITKVIVMGAPKYLEAFTTHYQQTLKPMLNGTHEIFANLHLPQQCMMKKICGRCVCTIKRHNGEEEQVFTCSKTDIELDLLPLDALREKYASQQLLRKLYSFCHNKVNE